MFWCWQNILRAIASEKNKHSLIKAGLSDETVTQNKKYLLRLLNFTGSSAEFCQNQYVELFVFAEL